MKKKKFLSPIIEWDLESCFGIDSLGTQITKISAIFHKYDLKGGADTITIRENLLPLFTQMEYVHLDGDIYKLSGRYTIKIDNNIEENTIIIGQDNYPNKIGKIKVINYG